MDEARKASIIFLVLGFLLLLALSFGSMFAVFLSSQPCPTAVMDCGPGSFPAVLLLMLVVPWVATIVGAVLTVIGLTRRRPSARAMGRSIMIAVASWVAGWVVFVVWPD